MPNIYVSGYVDIRDSDFYDDIKEALDILEKNIKEPTEEVKEALDSIKYFLLGSIQFDESNCLHIDIYNDDSIYQLRNIITNLNEIQDKEETFRFNHPELELKEISRIRERINNLGKCINDLESVIEDLEEDYY